MRKALGNCVMAYGRSDDDDAVYEALERPSPEGGLWRSGILRSCEGLVSGKTSWDEFRDHLLSLWPHNDAHRRD